MAVNAGFGAGLLVCAGFMAYAAIAMTFLPDLPGTTQLRASGARS
ncbi:hypothetical protein [Streptomyces sp. 7N604]